MMEIAFDSPFDDHRLFRRTVDRRGAMNKLLTEPGFAQAVSEGLPKLIAVARRLAGNEEIAAEAVQIALLKASKSWRKFQGHAHVQTWLTRIVIHSVRDAIASEGRQRAKNTSLDHDGNHSSSEQVIDPSRGPSQSAMDDELRQAIVDAVRQLPDRQREVFSLMVWQDMTANEVGVLLEINAQAVHANLHAARKRLREILQHLTNDDRRPSE